MSDQGARVRRSLLAFGLFVMAGGGLGCESSPSAGASSAREPGVTAASQPERVVQRMTPSAGAAPGSGSGSINGSPAPENVAANALSASRSPEPITSKHLEAELNRLEAELAN